MDTIETPDVRLHVTLDGPEGAPLLVLSNSLGATLDMWTPQVPAFARRWRVLRYDTRGHGRSSVPPGPYTISQLGGDVLRLLDALQVERAHICGLSMGGATALWLGAHAADRLDRLVLCNTAAYFGPREGWDTRLEAVRRDGLGGMVDAILDRWFTAEFRERDPATVARIRADILATPVDGYVACGEALRDMDERDALARIRAPTLVIGGTHDPAPKPEAARELASKIAGAVIVELAAAHLSNLGAAEAFTRTVTEFLSGSS